LSQQHDEITNDVRVLRATGVVEDDEVEGVGEAKNADNGAMGVGRDEIGDCIPAPVSEADEVGVGDCGALRVVETATHARDSANQNLTRTALI
jgi:hypothetical protein